MNLIETLTKLILSLISFSLIHPSLLGNGDIDSLLRARRDFVILSVIFVFVVVFGCDNVSVRRRVTYFCLIN